MKFDFPVDLYMDVRIEKSCGSAYSVVNNEVENNSKWQDQGAIIRVFDGKMWYTTTTNNIAQEQIQKEIENLAAIAKPNPNILKNKIVKNLQVNKAILKNYDGENDFRKVTKPMMIELVNHYLESCVAKNIEEVKQYGSGIQLFHIVKEFYSSKGSEICYDFQEGRLSVFYGVVFNEIPSGIGKSFVEFNFNDFYNHDQEIIQERERGLEYARSAVDVTPGEYTCVLAPFVTAMFTHECFGHKSESDFMLNDKTLQDEWVMGKKVGSDLVSICDVGGLANHGFTPYDDEGNKSTETWLVKKGILTGRLHDAKSASILKEKVTGNSRAQSYWYSPIVRMTNTYMLAGSETPEELISKIKDGIYVYTVEYGTGNSTFTMKPNICYKIRDGKICEPVRVNVITGSVFKALFDITGVANDFELFDQYVCGKGNQSVPVSAGGPTICVKALNVN